MARQLLEGERKGSQKHETPPSLAGLFQKNKDWIVMARRPFDSFFSLNHPGYQYIRGLPTCSERYMEAECGYFKACPREPWLSDGMGETNLQPESVAARNAHGSIRYLYAA